MSLIGKNSCRPPEKIVDAGQPVCTFCITQKKGPFLARAGPARISGPATVVKLESLCFR